MRPISYTHYKKYKLNIYCCIYQYYNRLNFISFVSFDLEQISINNNDKIVTIERNLANNEISERRDEANR